MPKKSKGEKSSMERLTNSRADNSELQYSIKSGEYVPILEVKDIWFKLISRFRKKLDTMPATLCSIVSLESSPVKNRNTIRNSIDSAFIELSKLDFNVEHELAEIRDARQDVSSETVEVEEKDEEVDVKIIKEKILKKKPKSKLSKIKKTKTAKSKVSSKSNKAKTKKSKAKVSAKSKKAKKKIIDPFKTKKTKKKNG